MTNKAGARWRQQTVIWVKWIWLLAVLIAAGNYLHQHFDVAVAMMAELPPLLLAASVLCLLFAKLLLAQNARFAADRVGANGTFRFHFRAYNLSQLGKYLPGSIWQFVGRYAIYRAHGFTLGQSRDALIAETGWVLGGALCAGVLLLTRPATVSVPDWEIFAPSGAAVLLVGSGLMLIAAVALWWLVARRAWLRVYLPTPKVVLLQLAIWGTLGLSFWLLLAPLTGYTVGPLYAVGLFGFAYAAGFLVPFAPAGIGIREGVMVTGLTGLITVESAVVVAIVARVLYVLVELMLVVMSARVRPHGTNEASGNSSASRMIDSSTSRANRPPERRGTGQSPRTRHPGLYGSFIHLGKDAVFSRFSINRLSS